MHFICVDNNKLDSVLDFLANGFGWSLNVLIKLGNIQCSNFSIEIYGFAMYDELDSICSGYINPLSGLLK